MSAHATPDGLRVTVLGCGGSGGVPLVGGTWGDCDPAEPRNRRLRPSILVEAGGRRVLIDTSPDLRAQLLASGVGDLDAVLFTHTHADHCHGIDDLRPLLYRRQRPIDAYGDADTLAELSRRFAYAFASSNDAAQGGYGPLLDDRTIEVGETARIAGLDVLAFRQGHGPVETLGFRIGPLAYSPDADRLDEAAFAALAGTRLWIVDCLRFEPHPSHAHLERVLGWVERVRPARTVLTHMSHRFDYRAALARCPAGVEPGYDGMTLEVDGAGGVRAAEAAAAP